MSAPPAAALAVRARAFLRSLEEEQRPAALFAFDDERRFDWHYIPRRQPGLRLNSMHGEQKRLAWAMVEEALSARGYEKATGITMLEGILQERTGAGRYDPENYALAVFGEPRLDAPWSWRIEGHHLSLTFTLVPGEEVTVTPAFLGANPAALPEGHDHAGLKLLGQEESLAFALLHGLDEAQRVRALLGDRSLGDIVTGPGREQSLRRPEGLPFAAMNEAQRDGLMRLLEEFVGNMRRDTAERELRRMREGALDKLHFAWAGAPNSGAPHYFRLHGPTVVIEYDNTQDGANHVHSVWHDPLRNFGADLLRQHRDDHHK